MATEEKSPEVIQSYTLNELRGILSDEIQKIRSGTTTAATVNAVSNATGKILSTIKLELEAAKLFGKKPQSMLKLTGMADEPAPSAEKSAA